MHLVKSSIINLKSYKPNDIPYTVKLDANEGFNSVFDQGITIHDLDVRFYPDSQSTKLRNEIGRSIGIPPENIIAGNGSSEMIELIIKTYVDKDEIILGFQPSFSMYPIYSQIYATNYVEVNSNADFSVDLEVMIQKQAETQAKVIFLCTPNNPTGYQIDVNEIVRLLEETNCMVVVDEAYIEFSTKPNSMITLINQYPNLIVLRTLSKAFGLASIRLGYMVSNIEVIDIINRVKSPYNLNGLTQWVGIEALKQTDKMLTYVEEVKTERELLYQALKELNLDLFPSQGNFIFFRSPITDLFEALAKRGILIRKFTGLLNGHYRVSIGSSNENQLFLKAMKEIEHERSEY